MRNQNENDPPADFTGLWVQEGLHGQRSEIEYVNGKPNGPFRRYLANGVVHREGCMQDGLYHGELVTRNVQGETLDVATFEHGTGTYRIFMTSGQLGWRIPLVRGKKHGLVERFNWRGELVRIDNYCDGELVSVEDRGSGID